MPRPGQEQVASRPLHFIWIADCSGSMASDGKMQSLNVAIKESLPEMKSVADENPFAEMLIRTVAFSSGAVWHDATPTKVHDFKWRDLTSNGTTDMGAAFELVAEELAVERMEQRGYPPVLALVSDGQPTDNYQKGLEKLLKTPWGKRAARVAIAIGHDAEHKPLEEFIGNIEFPVLQANNPQSLTKYIRFVSTEVSKAASSPASQTKEEQGSGMPVAIPTPPPADDAGGDVW